MKHLDKWTGLVLASVLTMTGQDYRAQITGQILDATGAVVPAAQVTVTNVATNVGAVTQSDQAGLYTALYLIPGNYTLTVEAQGFRKLARQGIEVRVSDSLKLDVTLDVGAVQDVISVTA